MQPSPHPRIRAALLLALSLGFGFASGVRAEPPSVDEAFHYRWHLTSFLGRLAGLFFPSRGEGVLSFRSTGDRHLESQLHITSEQSKAGEFWLYGAEIDTQELRTLEAWSAYKYGDKERSKRELVDENGVLDVASGIYRIRLEPPRGPVEMRIWSDGKIYPVRITPRGAEERRVGDRKVATREFSIRGIERAGERYWKGELDLWLADDERATPVAILIKRSGIGVLLELESTSRTDASELRSPESCG